MTSKELKVGYCSRNRKVNNRNRAVTFPKVSIEGKWLQQYTSIGDTAVVVCEAETITISFTSKRTQL